MKKVLYIWFGLIACIFWLGAFILSIIAPFSIFFFLEDINVWLAALTAMTVGLIPAAVWCILTEDFMGFRDGN